LAAVAAGGMMFISHKALAQQTRYQLKFESSPEYDSNARRVAAGGIEPIVADGLTRWSYIGQGEFILGQSGRHDLSGILAGGGKLFLNEQDEDVLVEGLDLGYRYRAGRDIFLGAALSGKDTTQKISRRDYRTAAGFGQLFLSFWNGGLTQARGGYRAFDYKPLDDFSYRGPTLGVEFSQRFLEKLRTTIGYDFIRRSYQAGALKRIRLGLPAQEIYIRSDQGRFDEDHTLSASLEYQSIFILRGTYYFEANNSNSAGESLLRHRFGAVSTFTPFWEIYIDISATLQFTSFTDGLSVSQQFFLEEDDENQTSFIIKISRSIFGPVALEARYALYRNQFSQQDIHFFRQVASLGLSVSYDSLEEIEQ
jgi:hypothetical protein